MAAVKKTGILLGMLYIPVSLYKTTQDISINFNQLCKNTHQRVKYKKYCPSCEKELTSEDIIKGYEYEKGKYVIVTEEELERIKTKENKTIHIIHFAKLSEVDFMYYDKNYYVVPESGKEKPLELLRQALYEEKKIAVAKTVFGTNESLILLCPTKEGMLAKTLFYQEEIQDMPKSQTKISLQKEELAMIKKVIQGMTKKFDISLYHDEYQEKLKKAIEIKIKGQNIVDLEAPLPNQMIDFMEALKRTAELSQNNKVSNGIL